MKRIFSISTFLFLCFIACATSQQVSQRTVRQNENTPFDSLHQYLNQILDDSIFSSCFIGIKIVSLNDGKILYERNSNKLFHPASNTKLFTTTAALNILDSGFRCKTEFSIQGKII